MANLPQTYRTLRTDAERFCFAYPPDLLSESVHSIGLAGIAAELALSVRT